MSTMPRKEPVLQVEPSEDKVQVTLLRRPEYEKFFYTNFGVSKWTVARWIKARVIPSIKIGGLILVDPEKALTAMKRFERPSVNSVRAPRSPSKKP